MKAADVMTPDPIVYFPGCFDHRRHLELEVVLAHARRMQRADLAYPGIRVSAGVT